MHSLECCHYVDSKGSRHHISEILLNVTFNHNKTNNSKGPYKNESFHFESCAIFLVSLNWSCVLSGTISHSTLMPCLVYSD